MENHNQSCPDVTNTENYEAAITRTDEITSSEVVTIKNELPTTSTPDVSTRLLVACPCCGSTIIKKSVGGYIEQGAALLATKAAKSTIMGDYGALTRGAENKFINEQVPFQQKCAYCHHTFHASKQELESGRYSMDLEKANRLTKKYNKRLQVAKDKEVKEWNEKADAQTLPICIFCFIFIAGFFWLLSGSIIFPIILMSYGGIGAFVRYKYRCSYTENAMEILEMSIQEYAVGHHV